ncbi:hypothetical protein Efla_006682 [Eimeria flavescens]
MALGWWLEAWPSLPSSRSLLSDNEDARAENSAMEYTERWQKATQAQRMLTPFKLLSVLLASLALVYLLLMCKRHLLISVKLSRPQLRLLAANFPNGLNGECPFSPGVEEEGAAAAAETDAAASGGLAATVDATKGAVATEEEWTSRNAIMGVLPGNRRILPEPLFTAVEGTLRLLEEVTVKLRMLRPFIGARDALSLTRTLAKLACLEASAFATIPDKLQPLRERVVQAYADLIEQVLSEGLTATMAAERRWELYLRTVQTLLHKLSRIPSNTERINAHKYRWIMSHNQQLSQWSTWNVLEALNVIRDHTTPAPTPGSNALVRQQSLMLHRLLATRTMQVLNQSVLRHWLGQQQRETWHWFLYDQRTLKQAWTAYLGTLEDQLNAISTTIVSNGGRLAGLTNEMLRLRQQVVQQHLFHYQHQLQLRVAAAHMLGIQQKTAFLQYLEQQRLQEQQQWELQPQEMHYDHQQWRRQRHELHHHQEQRQEQQLQQHEHHQDHQQRPLDDHHNHHQQQQHQPQQQEQQQQQQQNSEHHHQQRSQQTHQQQQEQQKPQNQEVPPFQGPLDHIVVVAPECKYIYTVLKPSGEEVHDDVRERVSLVNSQEQEQVEEEEEEEDFEGEEGEEGEEEKEGEEEEDEEKRKLEPFGAANQDHEFPAVNPDAGIFAKKAEAIEEVTPVVELPSEYYRVHPLFPSSGRHPDSSAAGLSSFSRKWFLAKSQSRGEDSEERQVENYATPKAHSRQKDLCSSIASFGEGGTEKLRAAMCKAKLRRVRLLVEEASLTACDS